MLVVIFQSKQVLIDFSGLLTSDKIVSFDVVSSLHVNSITFTSLHRLFLKCTSLCSGYTLLCYILELFFSMKIFFLGVHILARMLGSCQVLMQGQAKGCMVKEGGFIFFLLLEMLHLQLHRTNNNEFDSSCLIHLNVINV